MGTAYPELPDDQTTATERFDKTMKGLNGGKETRVVISFSKASFEDIGAVAKLAWSDTKKLFRRICG